MTFGFYLGLVSVSMSSCGNGMRAQIRTANSIHHGPCKVTSTHKRILLPPRYGRCEASTGSIVQLVVGREPWQVLALGWKPPP